MSENNNNNGNVDSSEDIEILESREPTPEEYQLFDTVKAQARQIVERVNAGTLKLVLSKVVDGYLFAAMASGDLLDHHYLVFSPDGKIGVSDNPNTSNIVYGVPIDQIQLTSEYFAEWLNK